MTAIAALAATAAAKGESLSVRLARRMYERPMPEGVTAGLWANASDHARQYMMAMADAAIAELELIEIEREEY